MLTIFYTLAGLCFGALSVLLILLILTFVWDHGVAKLMKKGS